MGFLRNIFLVLLFMSSIFITFIYAKLESSTNVELILGADNVYIYTDELTKKGSFVPTHPLIPSIFNYKIDRANYKEVYKLKLNYTKNQELMEKEIIGKYWNVSVRMVDWDLKAYRDEILKQFEDELKRLGGRVLAKENYSIIFKYKLTWGRFQAYNNSCKIKMVEEEGVEEEEPDDTAQVTQSEIEKTEEKADEVEEEVKVEETQEEKTEVAQEEKVVPDTPKSKPKSDITKLKSELDKGGKVRLAGISFESSKAKLKPDAMTAIKEAAELINKYPDLTFEVQGHTDSVGTAKSNLKLSDKRALAVKKVLIKEGVKKNRLVSKGYGETKPISPNKTKADREKNRRIVLKKITKSTLKKEKVVAVKKEAVEDVKEEPAVVKKNGVVTIDSVSALSGFKKAHTNKYNKIKLHLTINGIQGGMNISGKMLKNHYIAKKGKVSWKSIMKSHKDMFQKLGAEFLGDYKKNIYFYFDDRGDGKETYVILSAYNVGDYTVTFVIPPG